MRRARPKPDHGKKLLGAGRRLVPRIAVQHLRDHDIFLRREFGKKAMKLEDKPDMRSAQPPAAPVAELARPGAVDQNVAGAWLFQKPGDVQKR